MLWIVVNCPKQGASGAFRLATTLLPIPQGSYGDVDTFGERSLRKASGLTYFFDLNRIDMELTRWLTLTAIDLIHLSHAFYKTIEEIFFHYFHPLLSARSCAFWLLVKVSRMPLR